MNIREVFRTTRLIGVDNMFTYLLKIKRGWGMTDIYRNYFRYIPFTRHGFLYYNFYYEPETFKWIKNNIDNYDNFINIGVGYGEYFLYALFKGLHVVGYEPNIRLYRYVLINLLINGYNPNIIINKAVCNKENVSMVLCDTNSYIEGYGITKEEGEVVNVKCDNLNSLKLSGKTLFLIDVEGYENEVWKLIRNKLTIDTDVIIEVSKYNNSFNGCETLEEFERHRNKLVRGDDIV